MTYVIRGVIVRTYSSVQRRTEHDIKMTNDTRDKQDCQDSQENDPKYAPLFALRQGNMDKSVC